MNRWAHDTRVKRMTYRLSHSLQQETGQNRTALVQISAEAPMLHCPSRTQDQDPTRPLETGSFREGKFVFQVSLKQTRLDQCRCGRWKTGYIVKVLLWPCIKASWHLQNWEWVVLTLLFPRHGKAMYVKMNDYSKNCIYLHLFGCASWLSLSYEPIWTLYCVYDVRSYFFKCKSATVNPK